MFDGQKANPFWEALKHRHKLAFNVVLGILLLFGIVAFLTQQYSATAVVAVNPHASLSSDGQPRSAAEAAWTALTDEQIVSLIDQFQLDNGLVQLLGQNQGFTYLRSKISLHQIETPGSPSAEIAVSFTGQNRSTAIEVANAIAGTLAQVKAPVIGQQPSTPTVAQPSAPAAVQPPGPTAATPPNSELEKARSTLNMLAQGQNRAQALQKELQGRLRTGAQLQAARQADMTQLAQLASESERITLAASRAHPPAIPAANPARTALVERIKSAQAHLAELRQRYTEQYPDVEDAEANLARLQTQLDRMPPEKLQPPPVRKPSPTAEENNIRTQEVQLRADQQRLGEAIQANQDQVKVLRRRIAESNTFTQDYAAEQQRYNTLLQAQQTQAQQAQAQQAQQARQTQAQVAAHAPSPSAANTSQMTPLFIVVESATTADALGMAIKPSFWLLALLAGLLAASLVVFLVEQVSPTVVEKDISPRSLHYRA